MSDMKETSFIISLTHHPYTDLWEFGGYQKKTRTPNPTSDEVKELEQEFVKQAFYAADRDPWDAFSCFAASWRKRPKTLIYIILYIYYIILYI